VISFFLFLHYMINIDTLDMSPVMNVITNTKGWHKIVISSNMDIILYELNITFERHILFLSITY
jgi:hypothetical protein